VIASSASTTEPTIAKETARQKNERNVEIRLDIRADFLNENQEQTLKVQWHFQMSSGKRIHRSLTTDETDVPPAGTLQTTHSSGSRIVLPKQALVMEFGA
tara:strand:- start:253 stop:552 length:300 start_codon:yes stop_codon:yes gene_type:complete